MSFMRREIATTCMILSAVGILIFVEGEAATRFFHLESDVMITLDDCTGFKPIAGAEGYVNMSGGPRKIQINSAGFRDVEHTTEKEPGTTRILVLGDSLTEATQVPLDETYWRQLEKLLNQQGTRAEVISFGVASFGTNQELLAYGCYGRQYQPDVVLLAFFDGNDVVDNYFRKEPFVPRFSLVDGELELDETYKKEVAERETARRTIFPGVLYWVKDNSAFARMMYNKIQLARKGLTVEATTPELNPITLKSYPPEWEDAWDMTDALVAKLAQEVRADGAQLVVVHVPALEQLQHGEELDELRDFSKPGKRLEGIARKHRLIFIDLYPPLRDMQKTAPINFITDVHLNARGHAVVAETLSNTLIGSNY